MTHPWGAALIALFLWWFSTGAILLVVRRADRQGPRAHGRAVIWSLPMLLFGVSAIAWSLEPGGIARVYAGFLGALAVWGWIEMAFLTGVVTGPIVAPCPAHAPGIDRFVRAWGTIAYHELLLALALSFIALASVGAAEPVALWTFGLLFAARISAKLNLFFGVPRIHTEFLPRPLAHLPSYFRISRISWAFPASVIALSFTTAALLVRTMETGAAAHGLLTALAALALAEHWMMVLPLPDQKLWRWMLPAPPKADHHLPKEDTHGL